MYVCVCICMYICVYVYVCVGVYVQMHICIQKIKKWKGEVGEGGGGGDFVSTHHPDVLRQVELIKMS